MTAAETVLNFDSKSKLLLTVHWACGHVSLRWRPSQSTAMVWPGTAMFQDMGTPRTGERWLLPVVFHANRASCRTILRQRKSGCMKSFRKRSARLAQWSLKSADALDALHLIWGPSFWCIWPKLVVWLFYQWMLGSRRLVSCLCLVPVEKDNMILYEYT